VLVLAAIRVWQPDNWSWLSWVNAVIGVWLAIAPFVLGYTNIAAALWNDIIVGIAIIVLAAWSAIATPEPEVVT
jgi:VIT1/CCC1 family predicted Fe2+/Mn2+ transporter